MSIHGSIRQLYVRPGDEAKSKSRLLQSAWRSRSNPFQEVFEATFSPLDRLVEHSLSEPKPDVVYENRLYRGEPASPAAYTGDGGGDYLTLHSTAPFRLEPPPTGHDPAPNYPNPSDQVFVQHAIDEVRENGSSGTSSEANQAVAGEVAQPATVEPLFEVLRDEPFFQERPDRPDPYARYAHARAAGAIGDPVDQAEITEAVYEAASPVEEAPVPIDQQIGQPGYIPLEQAQLYDDPFLDPFGQMELFPKWPGFPGGW